MRKTVHGVLIALFLFNINSLQVFGQRDPSEISVFGGGGLSFFCYQEPLDKVSSIGYHFDIGVGFTGFVSQMCGFHVGAGFGIFHVKSNVRELQDLLPGKTDSNGFPFDLHASLLDYSETHKTMFLTVPLMFQFQTKQNQMRGGGKSFYAMTGVKLHVLFNARCDVRVATLFNAAYYPEFDNWAATQTFAGLGKFEGKESNEKFGVKLLPVFTLETGIKWNLKEGLLLYTGVYFDCGLNDYTNKNRKSVSEYNFTDPSLSLLAFYKRSNAMDVGIKLRLAFYKPYKKNSHKKPSHKQLPCHYTY